MRVVETVLRVTPGKSLLIPVPDFFTITRETARYIIKRLKMVPVAYIDAPNIPHRLVAVKGLLTQQLSIYSSPKEPLYVFEPPVLVTSDEHREALVELSETLISWCERNDFDTVIVLDVRPAEGDSLRVFYAAEEKLVDRLAKLGFYPLSGIVSETASTILDACMKSGIDGVLLDVESKLVARVASVYEEALKEGLSLEYYAKLAEALQQFDIEAVKVAVEAVSKVSGVEIPLDGIDEFLKDVSDSFRDLSSDLLKYFRRREPPLTLY